MTLINEYYSLGEISEKDLKIFLILLNLFSHITEEIWENMKFDDYILFKLGHNMMNLKQLDTEIEMPIQINGKVRATLTISKDAKFEDFKEELYANESVRKFVEGKYCKRNICTRKICNIVIK